MPTTRLVALVVSLTILIVSAVQASGSDVGVYRVPPQARSELLAMGATVRHGRTDGALVAELTKEQAEALERQGFACEVIFRTLADEDRALRAQPAFDQFHTYDQIRADFVAYAAAHPDIARYVVLGHSVQNRELFALKITSAPDSAEDEPKLAFWGGIHGNEYGGGEMPYRYALYLCNGYGTDPLVTRFVDSNEIWCIPMINPDGRVLGTRDNAQGVDLNRDFGYEWSGEGGSSAPFSQIETRTVRDFCAAHSFTLSTTFHCSGDIVFYPWGYAPQNVPDRDVIVSLSQQYASAASYAYGNSWQDYETHGELLDHAYGAHGNICLTIEVSNSAASVAQTFARNQAGMNLFCQQSGEGLRGMVTDAQTGQPLPAAVWIAGDPAPAYTDAARGDLHRVVPAGIYDLTVWASGFEPQTVHGVWVTEGSPGVFQVALQGGAGEYAYQVVTAYQRDPNHLHANVSFPASALGPADGVACSLGSGGYIVLDFGSGHEILDRPGPDFRVVEAITTLDPNAEAYIVYAGDAYTQTTLIGTGLGTTEFDLAGSGLSSVRYLKILDASGAPPNGPLAGMDLDAVIANINGPIAGAPVVALAGRDLRTMVSPNPSRSSALLSFNLAQGEPAQVAFFDAGGRMIDTPIQVVEGAAGRNEVRLDVSRWRAGVYFYSVMAGGGSESGRFVRVR